MKKLVSVFFLVVFILTTSCSSDSHVNDAELIQFNSSEGIFIDNIKDVEDYNESDFKCKWTSTMSVKFVERLQYWENRTKAKFYYDNANGNRTNTGWMTNSRTRTVKKARRNGKWYIDIGVATWYGSNQILEKSYQVQPCHTSKTVTVTGPLYGTKTLN